jgi:hypothetical protein
MKVKLERIFQAHPAFEFLAKQFYFVSHIAEMARLIDEVNKHYEVIAKKQEELLLFYGEKKEDGAYEVEDEKKPFYEKELSDFLDKEVEINWNKISVKELGMTVRLPLSAYKLLDFLFVDSIEEATEG